MAESEWNKWPVKGLVFSAFYLLLIFSLPCLPSTGRKQCDEPQQATQENRAEGQSFVIVCSQTKCSPQKERAANEAQQPCHAGAVCWGWHAAYNYWRLIEEDPVALFTGLLFFSTVLLWWVTERGLKHAERSSERQLRAYVWVRAISLNNFVVGEVPNIGLEIYNSGQTPAYDLKLSRMVAFSAYPLPDGALFPTFIYETGAFVLHPGTSPPFTFVAYMNDRLTQQFYDFLVGYPEQIRLYAYVFIKYRDAFDTERETWFCTSVLDPANPKTFEAGNRHNRAT